MKPWVNHFVAEENVHLATIEIFVLGSLGVSAWDCYNNSEMKDFQEPNVLSRSSACWRIEMNEVWCYDVLFRPLANWART